MLAQPYRIKKASDFSRTYKFGKSYNHNLLYIKIAKSNYSVSKVAVVVPKKVAKRAVDRNTYRRQIYEIIRKNFSNIQSGYTIIVTVKAPLSTIDHSELQTTIFNGFAKLKILQ